MAWKQPISFVLCDRSMLLAYICIVLWSSLGILAEWQTAQNFVISAMWGLSKPSKLCKMKSVEIWNSFREFKEGTIRLLWWYNGESPMTVLRSSSFAKKESKLRQKCINPSYWSRQLSISMKYYFQISHWPFYKTAPQLTRQHRVKRGWKTIYHTLLRQMIGRPATPT